jgi:hypothetical protein
VPCAYHLPSKQVPSARARCAMTKVGLGGAHAAPFVRV